MTTPLPYERGFPTPDVIRGLSAVLHFSGCVNGSPGAPEEVEKSLPKAPNRSCSGDQITQAHCTSLPPERALIKYPSKGVVQGCPVAPASLNNAVHRFLGPPTPQHALRLD